MDIFSIVSPSFNHEAYLPQTIESVLTQEGDFYIDYVIMDGGSKDQSVEIIKSYEQWLEANCDKVKVGELTYYTARTPDSQLVRCKGVSFRWHSGPDKGQVSAINAAFPVLQGSIFCYINSDDVFSPSAFRQVAKYFAAAPQVDVVYGNALFIDVEGKVIGAYPTSDVNTRDLRETCFLSQPSVFVRMSAARIAGLFNDKIQNSFDYEYWLRLFNQGSKFQYVPDVFSSTRMHPLSKTSQNQWKVKYESLAIVDHYGKIPFAWKYAFLRDVSGFFEFWRKVARVGEKSREWAMRVTANVYYAWHRSRIQKMEKKIFAAEPVAKA